MNFEIKHALSADTIEKAMLEEQAILAQEETAKVNGAGHVAGNKIGMQVVR